jgi:hypothetical protein
MPEIDETDFLQFQALGKVVNGMLANPKARKLLLQARKEADPNAAIPELDAAAPALAELASIKEALQQDREERRKAEEERATERAVTQLERKLEQQRSRLRAAGWTDDGIAEVEKHAESEGLVNLEIAAAHYEKLHPPAEPVTPNGHGGWGFFDRAEKAAESDEFIKAMVDSRGKDDAALMREARAAIQEVRQQAQRR